MPGHFRAPFALAAATLAAAAWSVACITPAAAVSAPVRLGVPARAATVREVPANRSATFRFRAAPGGFHVVSAGPLLVRPLMAATPAVPMGWETRPVSMLSRRLVTARFVSAGWGLGLAAVAAPLLATRCTSPRSGVLIDVLPVAPFVPLACRSNPFAGIDGTRPASLQPGRNKAALYGPAYSPKPDDDQ